MPGADNGSPWSAPDDRYVPPPPSPATPPAAEPYAPYAPPPSMPYAATPYAPPPPTWATPQPVPARAGRSATDPWRLRGWRGGGSLAVRLLGGATLLLGALTVFAAAAHVDERAYAKDDRASYLAAHGVVHWPDDRSEPVFTGQVDDYGTVVVPLGAVADDEDVRDGHPITLLVMPGDPSDFIMPSERANTAFTLGLLVVCGVLTAGAAAATVLVSRARRVDLDAIRYVAARVPDGPPPGPLTTPLRADRRRVATNCVLAALFVGAAVLSARVAAHDVHRVPATVTAGGRVEPGTDDAGHRTLVVHYYDDRVSSDTTRPLTPAERARGPVVGSDLAVTYRSSDVEVGHGDAVVYWTLAAFGMVWALALLRRAILFPVLLRRAQREPAHPEEVLAWVRVVRRRAWLMVLPPGATRARHVVALVVWNDSAVPAAFTGRVYVHGRIARQRVAVIRAPSGDVIASTRLAEGHLGAELSLLPAGPPLAPRVNWGW